MTRTVTGLFVAAALGFAVSVGAQSTSTDQRYGSDKAARDVTVTGCLSKGAEGGFTLTNARMDSSASAAGSPSTTTASGTTGTTATTTTGTTGTTASTTAGAPSTPSASNAASAGASAAPVTFMLSGGQDLDRHVGHRIQVTGRTTWDPSMDRTRRDESAAAGTTTATTTATTASTPATTTSSPATTTGTSGSMTSSNQPRLEVQSIKMVSTNCQ